MKTVLIQYGGQTLLVAMTTTDNVEHIKSVHALADVTDVILEANQSDRVMALVKEVMDSKGKNQQEE